LTSPAFYFATTFTGSHHKIKSSSTRSALRDRIDKVVHESCYAEKARIKNKKKAIIDCQDDMPATVPLAVVHEVQWRLSQSGPEDTRVELNTKWLAGVVYSWVKNSRKERKAASAGSGSGRKKISAGDESSVVRSVSMTNTRLCYLLLATPLLFCYSA